MKALDRGIHTRARILLVLSMLVLFLPLFPIPSTAGYQDMQTFRVGYFNNQPVSFITGEKEELGIALDVVRQIALEEGLELKLERYNRSTAISKLIDGELDMIAGIETPCVDMKGLLLSNETIVSNWGEIFAGDGQDIGSIMDLDGKWIGVVKEDLYYNGRSGLKNLIESFSIDAEMVEYDNFNEVLEAIDTGNVDAGCLNNLLGTSEERKHDIHRTGVVYNPVDLRFVFHPNGTNSHELRELFDKHLSEMKLNEDSVYFDSLERYLEEYDSSGSRTIIPWWVPRALLILLIIVVFLIVTTAVLRARVRSKTRELRDANVKLDKDIKRRIKIERKLEEERNRSIFYLDLLIHDIGNIHHGLVSTMQLYEMVKEDREKADRTQLRAMGLVDRSINLIRNVRKYTEATTKPIDPEPCDLKSYMDKALESVKLSFPEKDPLIRKDYTEEKLTTMAEPLLEEVFYNLLHNAVNYSKDKRPSIEVMIGRSDKRQNMAYVCIGDHGRGISDEMKKVIFHRPMKAHELKHTGMGLSLVKALLDRYNCKIEVKDRDPKDYRKGTIFTIYLPIEEGPSHLDH